MSFRLYIGNLPHGTTNRAVEVLLRNRVAEVGPVEILTDRMTGHSRGFGFSDVDTTESTAGVLEKLQGLSLEGRTLTLTEARPKERRDSQDRGTRSSYRYQLSTLNITTSYLGTPG